MISQAAERFRMTTFDPKSPLMTLIFHNPDKERLEPRMGCIQSISGDKVYLKLSF